MPSANFVDMLEVLRAKRTGARAWVACCPSHDDHSPSLTIYEGDKGQPLFVCGRCEWRDVRDALRERGCKIVAPKKRGAKGDVAEVPVRQAVVLAAPDFSGAALKLWQQSVCGRGTPVEAYLRGRGLGAALDLCPDILSRSLRFHAACPRGRGTEAVRLPAMLALMRDVATDKPVAIHRTFLDGDARKHGKPMMLGPCEHAAVKLSSHSACFPSPLGLCAKLHVAEGIETALAAMMLGYAPMWALGSAGAIERFAVIEDVLELCVCADHDKVGRHAAAIARANWWFAQREAEVLLPAKAGCDFADLVAP